METKTTSAGIGFGGLLFIVFLVLKLCNVITWSWWWVTAPIWAPIALFLLFFMVMGLFAIQANRRNPS